MQELTGKKYWATVTAYSAFEIGISAGVGALAGRMVSVKSVKFAAFLGALVRGLTMAERYTLLDLAPYQKLGPDC